MSHHGKRTQCQYCKRSGFHWQRTPEGFRLFSDETGEKHICPERGRQLAKKRALERGDSLASTMTTRERREYLDEKHNARRGRYSNAGTHASHSAERDDNDD